MALISIRIPTSACTIAPIHQHHRYSRFFSIFGATVKVGATGAWIQKPRPRVVTGEKFAGVDLSPKLSASVPQLSASVPHRRPSYTRASIQQLPKGHRHLHGDNSTLARQANIG